MSNRFDTEGTITHITAHPTSLFLTIKEDGQYGNYIKVKAFCPRELKETPEVWSSHFTNHRVGARVRVAGSLSFDKETMPKAEGPGYEPVKHPVTGRDLYGPFIWATRIDILFDPALHMIRPQAESQSGRPPESRSAAARHPAPQVPDGLPPLALDDQPVPSRARVAWNDS